MLIFILYLFSFTMQQIYHKQILGNSLRVMKAQLGINLSAWRNKNV